MDSMTWQGSWNEQHQEVIYTVFDKIWLQSANNFSAYSRDDDAKTLFRCIVTLDYFRILSRLRSRHAKKDYRKKDRPLLITSLIIAIHDKSIQPSSSISRLELKNVRAKVTALKGVFQRFEDIPNHCATSVEVQETIMDLITQMYELGSQMKFKSALESSKLEKGVKESLPVAVGKIGRYYSISYELVCAARNREYSILNKIVIEKSSIRRPTHPLDVDSSIDPFTALQNLFRPKTAAELRTLQRSLESRLKKSVQEIADEFRVIIKDYYQFAKVHAEIQLLFFYEQNPKRLPPRVICSSKSACYLCDLFFKLHGRFYMPRTHGRLYHKWILPDWRVVPEMRRLEFKGLLTQFRDALEARIRAALESGPMRIRHPNESVLVMPAHWSSSTITEVNPLVSGMKIAGHRLAETRESLSDVFDSNKSGITSSKGFMNQDLLSSEPVLPAELQTSAASSSSKSNSTLHSRAQEPVTNFDKIPIADTFIPPVIKPPHNTSPNSSFSSLAILKPYYNLTPSENFWQHISCPNTSINIGTTRLHLQLSYDSTDSSTSKVFDSSSSCWVRVRWLLNTELETIKAKTQVVNLDDLPDDTEMTLENGAAYAPTELYIKHGEDVFSIKYAFERKTEMKTKATREIDE